MRLSIPLVCLLIPATVAAQIEVWPGIRAEEAEQIPMWLESFESEGGLLQSETTALEQVVLADLSFTGYFRIARGKPLDGGKNEDFSVVVRGKVFEKGGKNYFEGWVMELSSGQFIGGKRYRLKEGITRDVAHHFSDEVVYWLTGERGIATSQIVFTRESNGMWELLISDYDGHNPRILVRQSTPIVSPRWVDEGKAVVYTSYRHGKPDLFIRYLIESASKLISSYEGLNYSVDWSEERRKMVVTLSKDGDPEIYLMRVDGGIERRLTHNRAIDCSPSWAPSGREVLFTSDRSGNPQIYIMEADGSNVRRLTHYGSYNASPTWSPFGDLIAFVSRIDGVFHLCTIRPDGTEHRLITSGWLSHEDPQWAPDGKHIVYTERGRSGPVISVVDITTGAKRILCEGSNPDWSFR